MHPPLPRNGPISVTAEVLSCQRRMSSEFNLGLAGTCRKKWLGLGSEEEHKKIPESVNFMHWKLANIPRLYKMLTLRGALLTTLYLLMNLRDTSFKISPPNACPSTSSSQQVNMKRMPLAFAAIILGALATDAQTVVTVLIPTGSCVPERSFSSEISSSMTYINTTILPLGTSTSLSRNEANTYGYQVIVVHYLVSENVWECIQVVGDSVYNDDNIRQSHECSSCNIGHAIEPNCTQGSWYNYYQGFGYTLNSSDPSSRLHSRIFDGHFDACSVVAQCTNFAERSSQAPHMSINLYYGETESVWLCIVSLGSPDPALFSVRNPDISYAFGLCGPTGC